MLVHTLLVFASVSLNMVWGSVPESNSPQNITSSFSSVPIDSSSTSSFSNNFRSDVSSSSSPVSSSSILQKSVISNNIHSSGMVQEHQFTSNPRVSDNVFSSKPSSFVPDNIFTSGVLPTQGITFFDLTYPCYRSALNSIATGGPETCPLPVLQAPPLTVPTLQGPMVALSNPPVPKPTVIASKCICRKTIVKPQFYQRTITVPKVEHYLTRTVSPVVENVAFNSKPISSCKCAACADRNKASAAAALIGSTLPLCVSRSISPYFEVW